MVQIIKKTGLVLLAFFVTIIVTIYILFYYFTHFDIEHFKEFRGEKFTKEKWALSEKNPSKRGKMLYSFFQTHQVIEIHYTEIKKILGEYSYYFLHDQYPTYIVKRKDKTYILVFITDGYTGKIKTAIIFPKEKEQQYSDLIFFF